MLIIEAKGMKNVGHGSEFSIFVGCSPITFRRGVRDRRAGVALHAPAALFAPNRHRSVVSLGLRSAVSHTVVLYR